MIENKTHASAAASATREIAASCSSPVEDGFLQSWQHSTIARRVEFLQRVEADPSIEPRFQRMVSLVKWAVVLALAVALLALIRG